MFKQRSLIILFTFFITSCSIGSLDIDSSGKDNKDDPQPTDPSDVDDSEEDIVLEDLFEGKKIKPIAPTEDEPHITLDSDVFYKNGAISVNCFNCAKNDRVELYPFGGYPIDMEPLTYKLVQENSSVSLQALTHKNETKYYVYLTRANGYTVLDRKEISLANKSEKNYGVTDAKFSYENNEMKVTITPSADNKLTYEIYWAKNGKRLTKYSYIKTFSTSEDETFTESLGKYLVMPTEANQIEVYVMNGKSESFFVNVDDSAKIKSKYLYSFNVFSDIHTETFLSKPNHIEHIEQALNDCYNYNKDCKCLFINGDLSNLGTPETYDPVIELIDIYKNKANCPVYYSIGNHEYANVGTFEGEIELFKQKTRMPDIFCTKEVEGSTCIFMGSDVQTTMGEINDEHIAWLKEQLDNANKDKPIYIFLHQPLYETVSGSLKGQGWSIVDEGDRMKNLLKNYKNVFFFSGHTHWEMESKSDYQVNVGATSYINCAAVGYLWNDNNRGEPGSEGLFVDVYDDCLVFRGREFTKNIWLSYANFCIPLVK